MSWPLSQDYNEAIQAAAANFADSDLKRGEVVVNALGLPIPYSGNFADVYQVKCPDGSRWAVKCFTREAAGGTAACSGSEMAKIDASGRAYA